MWCVCVSVCVCVSACFFPSPVFQHFETVRFNASRLKMLLLNDEILQKFLLNVSLTAVVINPTALQIVSIEQNYKASTQFLTNVF